jgi:phosphoglycolate phosphatase
MEETGFAPEDTVMIGDTVFDMAMARAAAVRGLGVAWGYHDDSELIEHGAERVLAKFSDLAPALAR